MSGKASAIKIYANRRDTKKSILKLLQRVSHVEVLSSIIIPLTSQRMEAIFFVSLISCAYYRCTLGPRFPFPVLHSLIFVLDFSDQFPNSAVNTSGNNSTPNSWKSITRYMKTPIVFSNYVAIQVYFRCAPYGSLVEQAYDEATPTGRPHHVFMAC